MSAARGVRPAAGLAARVAVLVAVTLGAAPARADERFLLTGEANLGFAVSPWQSRDFGPGGAVALGVYRSLAPFLLVGVRGRGGVLANGGELGDGRADLGPGTWASVGGALRLRPAFDGAREERGVGVYLEGSPGVTFTGDVTRFGLEAAIGYAFAVGGVDAGPVLRFVQIVEPVGGLDDRDARLLLFGIEAALFDGRTPKPKAVAEAVRPDRDGDGIFDEDDGCPDDPEDADGFEDLDGCPDRDNDRDGLGDLDDKCPNEPEDMDGFEDTDGCPDPDNDRDGFLDEKDQCPTEPETVNGNEDEDGCPDEGLIELRENRIVLEETVLFDFEKARVKSSARPIVEAIVKLWKQHAKEWTKVRVEGHADARGDQAFNKELSQRRAAQVRAALIDVGIPDAIIEAEGYGATKLRDLGTTERAHQRNRRVEFVVYPEGNPGAEADKPAEDKKPGAAGAGEGTP